MPNVFWDWAQEWEMIGAILSLVLGLPSLPAVYLMPPTDYWMGVAEFEGAYCDTGPTNAYCEKAIAFYALQPASMPFHGKDSILRSNCYDFGEAHNELTLPCVTIEP